MFGAGFGLLGYCPGTVAGAVGQGALAAGHEQRQVEADDAHWIADGGAKAAGATGPS